MAKKYVPYDEKYYDREVETMPRPELEKLQLERLKDELVWSYENSPYYKRTWDEAGIDPHIEKAEEMIEAARKIAAISPNFAIKIPMTEDGVIAARVLEAEGIRTNLTLVFSAAQAIWAGKVGSLFVSPFIGWKEANGEDCRQYIKDIVDGMAF